MILLTDLSATAAPPIATRARCTAAVVADLSLRGVLELLSQKTNFDVADQVCAVGQLGGLGNLAIMQPLLPLVREAEEQRHELGALRYIGPHLPDIRIVLLVQAVSDYLRKPSEHLWQCALLNILKQWAEEGQLG